MKKSLLRTKLTLRHETVKLLKLETLQHVAGAGPVKTRDLPCDELTLLGCD